MLPNNNIVQKGQKALGIQPGPVSTKEAGVPNQDFVAQGQANLQNLLNPQKPQAAKWDYKNADKGPNGESLPATAKGWRPDGTPDFGDGIEGWWKKAQNNFYTSWEQGWQEGEKIKQQQNYSSDLFPRFTSAVAATKAIGGEAFWGLLNIFGQGAQLTERAAGFTGYSLRDIIAGRPINASLNWEASRLTYGEIYKTFIGQSDQIRQEFDKRMQNGERPDLIAEDMAINGDAHIAWFELGGNVIFDPLNADLFATWMGKGRRALKLAETVREEFAVVENPQLAEMVKTASNGSGLSSVKNASTAMTAAREALNNTSDMITSLSKPGVVRNLEGRAKQVAFLTSDSRRLYFVNRSGEVVQNIITALKGDPQDVMDTLKAMADFAGKNPEDAAAAFRKLYTSPRANVIFSKAGNESMILVSKMMDKYGDDWMKVLKAASKEGGVEKVAEVLLGRLDSAISEAFPSAIDMINAEKKVSAVEKGGNILKKGEKITEQDRVLAEGAKNLSRTERWVATANETAQKTVVGTVNKFFANIYMNWSPAYVVRNTIQNSLQIFVDYGPAGLVKKGDEVLATAEKFHGGHLPGTEGFSSELFFEEGSRVVKKTGLVEAVKAAAESKGFRAANDIAEANAARKVVGHTYTQTFKGALKPLIESLRNDRRFADVPDKLWPVIQSELLNNYGDVEKTIQSLQKISKKGIVNEFGKFENLPKPVRNFLEQAHLDDEVRQLILNAKTKEQASKAVDNVMTRLENASKSVYTDRHIADPKIPDEAETLRAVEDGILSEASFNYYSKVKQVNNEAINAASEAIGRMDDEVQKLVANVSAETRKPVQVPLADLKKQNKVTALGEWGSKTSEELDAKLKVVRAIDDASHGHMEDVPALWEQAKKFMPNLPDLPEKSKQARNILWPEFKEYQKATWAGARNSALEGSLGYAQGVEEALKPYGGSTNGVVEARKAIEEAVKNAKAWDSVAISDGGILVQSAPVADRATELSNLAKKYGVDENEILSVINKYGKTDFKTLKEQISLDLAERALANRAGVELPPEIKKAQDLLNISGMPLEEQRRNLAKLFPELANDVQYLSDEEVKTYSEMNKALSSTLERDMATKASTDEKLRVLGHQVNNGGLDEVAKGIQEEAKTSLGAEKALVPPYQDGEIPSYSRMLHENNLPKVRKMLTDYVESDFGKMSYIQPTKLGKALNSLKGELANRVNDIRITSSQVAQENRNFTLLNYGMKSYWDVAASYVMPYEFWYNHSYSNWMQRFVYNPAVLGAYGKYKNTMSQVHSNLPEWWKYNINSNDVTSMIGIHLDNPLYFNLEQTLWPLNGITGTDFNDPEKQTNWWTYTLNEINKYGPSTWTPISMVTGLALYAQGNKDAGSSWLGRLFPQSTTIKALTGMETDPMVNIFQGGYDKYERRQIERELAQMVEDKTITEEQAVDAGYAQTGPVWDKAAQMRNDSRSGYQTASFLFGVGFKARTQNDMKIDQFYTEFDKLMNTKANLSPEQFNNQMDGLRQKYPWMNTILLSKRTGPQKDSAYAYDILSRIPPGQTTKYLNLVNIDPTTADTFYKNKGDFSKMSDPEKQTFMAGIANLGAYLAAPPDATKTEWVHAKNEYTKMQDTIKNVFGKDIIEQINQYRNLSGDAARALITANPDIQTALDMENKYIVSNGLLYKYYGGIRSLESFYYGQMYDQLDKKYGGDFSAKWKEYYRLRLTSPSQAKDFYNKYLAAYQGDLRKMEPAIVDKVAKFGQGFEDHPNAFGRADFQAQNEQQKQIQAQAEQQKPTFDQWTQILDQAVGTDALSNIIINHAENGGKIPSVVMKELDYQASQLGYSSGNKLLEEILASYPNPLP